MSERLGKKRIFAWSLLPAVLSLAWPTMLEQLLQTAVQYIDTAMVGSLGTQATAAVGSTATVGWLVGSSTYAFGVGFLAYISQALGAGDDSRAKKAAGQSVLAVLVVGLFFTVVTLSLSPLVPVWMQVDSAPWPPATSSSSICPCCPAPPRRSSARSSGPPGTPAPPCGWAW